MDNDEPDVYAPREDETLKEYLRRYTSEDIQRILEDSTKRELFYSIVVGINVIQDNVGHRTFRDLWSILQRMGNYNDLLYFIGMWEPTRKELLQMLSDSGSELNKISKWCTLGRLMGSTIDTLGTVGGLYFPESRYSTIALRTATSFGLLALVSTVTEMKISKDIYYDLVTLVHTDQELFAPIQLWYRQTEELERAMKNIFPFDVTESIVKEFDGIVNEDIAFNPVRLFSRLLRDIAETDRSQLHNQELVENLVNFTNTPASQELCEWIFFKRQHPAVLDIARMVLQYYYSPLSFLFCQSVKALAPVHQSLYSAPVLGRIGLNTFSAIDAISRLWRYQIPGISTMKRLKSHMELELRALRRIAYLVNARRND